MNKKKKKLNKIHSRILNKIIIILSDMLFLLQLLIKVKIERRNKLFLVCTPEYHNIGDIAIMEGEKKFFEHFFSQYALFEISLEVFRRNKALIRYLIINKDPIFITGGGFIGNMWEESNDIVIYILKNYKKNSIVILPQTVFYVNDISNEDFNKDRPAYEEHKDCLIIVREKTSYKFVNDNLKFMGRSRCILAPDMALFLHISKNNIDREGVMLCLRHDKERNMTDIEYEILINTLKEAGHYDFLHTDTAYDKGVKRNNRSLLLSEKINEFSKSELVITDRLHGMIIAAITGTPCIAIASASHKILGVYQWINNLNYIQVITNYNNLRPIITAVSSSKNNSYNRLMLDNEFKQLSEEINNSIKRKN